MEPAIWYTLHLMWYEYEMVDEHLVSLHNALKFSKVPVVLYVCLNYQTYIETPLVDNREEAFDRIRNHPILKDASFVIKTDEDPFYNIGDWRRDIINPNGYTCWGEADTLLPEPYFYVLSSLMDVPTFPTPHVLTFSSRKMWDMSWNPVEVDFIAKHPTKQHDDNVDPPMNWHDYITLDALNEINTGVSPMIDQLDTPKIDGALTAFHGPMPQLIPNDLHFAREDFCAQLSCEIYGIPQFHVSNILKGHNYKHPLKRVNTDSSREDDVYRQYEQASNKALARHIQSLR